MGLNNRLPLYRNEATCENRRPLASNICELFQRQCLQLRRCLVGSPLRRVEALQRLKFPQPVVCGGDIWREKYPEHLWLENNLGFCSERRIQREHTQLFDLTDVMKVLRFDPHWLVAVRRIQAWGGRWIVLHWSCWNGETISGVSAKIVTEDLNCLVFGPFPGKKREPSGHPIWAPAHHIPTLKLNVRPTVILINNHVSSRTNDQDKFIFNHRK